MATIKLQGNSSGSGTIVLTAPNTNSTRTVTLPDQDLDLGGIAGAGSVKAWVNFNGTGTVSIRDDGNVSSITDHTTGKYTVNTSTAMPSANFSANCDGCRVNSDIALIAGPVHFAFTTTSFRMRTLEYDASSADSLNTCVTITH